MPNAIALTSAVGNSARITGPAIAGLLIGSVGVAWVFFVNAVSFVAVVVALFAMRASELHRVHRHTARPRVREGLEYAWSIREIRATIVLVGVVGTLVYNFPTAAQVSPVCSWASLVSARCSVRSRPRRGRIPPRAPS